MGLADGEPASGAGDYAEGISEMDDDEDDPGDDDEDGGEEDEDDDDCSEEDAATYPIGHYLYRAEPMSPDDLNREPPTCA